MRGSRPSRGRGYPPPESGRLRPLAGVLISAAVTCFVALFLGQGALRLAGAREWSWLAPIVGLAVTLLLASPTDDVPGRATTMAVLVALLTVAAAVWCLRSPPHRPPLTDLLAGLPVVVLVLVPFLAVGHGGILGVTINNDMAVHLLFVEDFLDSAAAVTRALPTDYPLGPHASAALLSRGLGVESDLAFSGWTMAIPILTGWTVLAAARNAAWYGKAIAATLVAMPYLVAAYYGQGSFKEVAQAGLLVGVTLLLAGCGPRLERGRWVPLALLVGGVVTAYSPAGLTWVVAIVALWLAGLLVRAAAQRRLGEVPGVLRRELPALAIGAAVFVVVLASQTQRMFEFVSSRDGTGISTGDIGNLVARLPGWEALGVWDNAEYRFLASESFVGGFWSWFVVAVIALGAVWAIRRGRWLLPATALAALLIWRYSDNTQSIYVAAKALMIASPLLLLVAVQPLLDREGKPWSPRLRALSGVSTVLGLVLAVLVVQSSLRTLTFIPVGPTDHARQLIGFRPEIAGEKVLFFGEDEFYMWELVGSEPLPISVGATPQVPLRPEKEWEFGRASDFDSLPATALNEFDWFVTTGDAATSEPPPQIRLAAETDAFRLWQRTGEVRERSILAEGEWPGAVLRCGTEEGRAILRGGGVAAIRPQPVMVPVDPVQLGGSVDARIVLPAGEWDLSAPYVSRLPIQVSGPGLDETVPASLDRRGPRLPLGRIDVPRSGVVTITFEVEDRPLAPSVAVADIGYVAATRADVRERVVPIEQACGKYVDWYRSER